MTQLQLPAGPVGRFLAADDTTGRPTIYSEELAIRFCERLAEGGTLRKVCAEEGMPAKRTVLRWALQNPDFRRLYAFALAFRAEAFADDIIEIADDSSEDYAIKDDGDAPRLAPNPEAIARSRLRIDARKWLMAKCLPKKYGDNPEGVVPDIDQEENGEAPAPRSIANDPLSAPLEAYERAGKTGGDVT